MATRTILGPLTTTYTQASTCTSLVADCSTCSIAWQDQLCYARTTGKVVDYGVEDRAACWPPATASTVQGALLGWGFYSPGVVCPAGHTSACTATYGGKSEWPVQYAMTAGETAVGCCPNGYNCVNGGYQTCVSLVTSTSIPLVSCRSGTTAAASVFSLPLTYSATVSSTVTVATVATYSLYAPLIQINWQSSDLPSTASPTSTPTPASSSSTSKASSGLSTGASAGIGVGVALAVIALLLAGLLLWRRKRKYSLAPQAPVYEMNHDGKAGQMGYSEYQPQFQPPVELGSQGHPQYHQGASELHS